MILEETFILHQIKIGCLKLLKQPFVNLEQSVDLQSSCKQIILIYLLKMEDEIVAGPHNWPVLSLLCLKMPNT